MRRYARLVAVTCAVGYALLCVGLVTLENSLVYPAPKTLRPASKAMVLPIPGGTSMLWVPGDGVAPTVVFFHGNGEQVSDTEWLAGNIHDLGIGFAAIEYPGYAGTPGVPGEQAMLEAGEAGLRHLTGPMGIAPEQLVLCGQSLGTGIAVQLAARSWGRKLVLLTPYTSLPDVGADEFPYLPVRLLMKNRFDSASWAPKVRQPVMIIHGTNDVVVAFEQGKALSAMFAPPAQFVEIPSGTHFDLWDREYVYARVAQFILK